MNVSKQAGPMGIVTIGYMRAISDNFLLGIGAEYNPLASKSGNYTYAVSGANINGHYELQNTYNVFLSPATPVGADGLLYGKVGYTSTSIEATDSGNSNSNSLSGFSLGLGYRQTIQAGLYGFGEVNFMSYSNKANSYAGTSGANAFTYTMMQSVNVLNAVVGVGYKF